MNRVPRAKEVEYHAALRVLSATKFIEIRQLDGSIRGVGFSDIIQSRELLRDAVEFLKRSEATYLLVEKIIGPLLLSKMQWSNPSVQALRLYYEKLVETIRPPESYSDAENDDEIVVLLKNENTFIRDTIREKLMITKAVLGMVSEDSSSIMDFVYISSTLAQTAPRTLCLYCRPLDNFDPTENLAEQFLQLQIRLRQTPNAQHLANLTLTPWTNKRKHILALYDATLGVLESKFQSFKKLQDLFDDLELSEEADTSRQEIVYWMRDLKEEGVIEYAPKFVYDPLLGRFLRYAQQERGVNPSANKYPFGFHAKNRKSANYRNQVADLKRKIDTDDSESERPAKRKQKN